MEVDPITPTSPLRRKRTFHDLSDATSSLALQTPNPDDPHYGESYFSNVNDLESTRNPFALSSLGNGGTPDSATRRSERSISPSKRIRILNQSTCSSVEGAQHPPSPSPLATEAKQSRVRSSAASDSLSHEAKTDVAMDTDHFATTLGPALVAALPGRIIPLEQCSISFDTAGLMQGLITEDGARGPTANWANADWGSAVLLYTCPPWREDFGRGSGGYVSHLGGIGGLGMGFEGLCVAVHTTLAAASPTAQALAISDRLDLPLQTAPSNHMQELTSVLPVRRHPEAASYLVQAAAQLLHIDPGSRDFSDGLLVLVDHQSKIRLVLPMSETRNVAVTASTSGSISVARRKAISGALEGVLREALTYLEDEKVWLRNQR